MISLKLLGKGERGQIVTAGVKLAKERKLDSERRTRITYRPAPSYINLSNCSEKSTSVGVEVNET